MKNLTNLSCKEFISALGSKSPVPGGGGAAALVGAAGAALGSMVASLTVGKSKYADVEEDMRRLKAEAERLQAELLELAERDAEAFAPLAEAYGMPRGSGEELAERGRVMEAALKDACAAPLAVMRGCCEVIRLHADFAEKGSRLAVSDAGAGAVFCLSALRGAALNIFINTGAMADRVCAEKLNAEAEALLAEYEPLAERVYRSVKDRLSGS